MWPKTWGLPEEISGTPVVAGASEEVVSEVRVRRSGQQRHHPVLASNPRPDSAIGETSVDLPIEPVDDFDERVAGHAKASGHTRLVTRHT